MYLSPFSKPSLFPAPVWVNARNAAEVKADWQFTTTDARTKPKTLLRDRTAMNHECRIGLGFSGRPALSEHQACASDPDVLRLRSLTHASSSDKTEYGTMKLHKRCWCSMMGWRSLLAICARRLL